MPPLPSLSRFAALLGLFAAAPLARAAGPLPVDVITYHNDDARTGQYPHETVLTPANVNAASFGKRFDAAVDGQMYAQPLYVAGLSIPDAGRHNVVFAVTEHDGIYAFDADTGATLWQRTLLGTFNGVTVASVPYTELPGKCGQIQPELGITATPAVDVAGGTLYVAAMTKETTVATGSVAYFQRLHALDLATGAEKTGSPVAVEAAVPGTADGGSTVTFIPLDYKERTGLVLRDGIVYTAWASHCDVQPYHGWVIGYDAATLRQVNVYNNTADGAEASFWDGGAAPAVDAAGNLYLNAGNGTFDVQNDDGTPNPAGVDLGESITRLSTAGGHLTPADWFTPFNKTYLNQQDLDTGSAGTVLYDVNGAHLLATAGKEGRIYILDRDHLGHYTPNADAGAVQTVPAGSTGIASGLFGCPAFFQSAVKGPTLYFSSRDDYIKAFILDPRTGKLPGTATSQSKESFSYPGTVPAISSNAGANGILWVASKEAAQLHAYDANDLATELYINSLPRDFLGSYVKFTTPIIAQGKVFVGTADHLAAFGLINPIPPTDVTAQVAVRLHDVVSEVAPTGPLPSNPRLIATITNHNTKPITGPVSLVLDGLGADLSLDNATGTTSETTPRASFYIDAVPAGRTLAAGASASVALFVSSTAAAPPPAGGGPESEARPSARAQFTPPPKNSGPAWTTRVLAGPGAR